MILISEHLCRPLPCKKLLPDSSHFTVPPPTHLQVIDRSGNDVGIKIDPADTVTGQAVWYEF